MRSSKVALLNFVCNFIFATCVFFLSAAFRSLPGTLGAVFLPLGPNPKAWGQRFQLSSTQVEKLRDRLAGDSGRVTFSPNDFEDSLALATHRFIGGSQRAVSVFIALSLATWIALAAAH